MTETLAEILDAYRRGPAKPEDIIVRSFARIRLHDDPSIFIALRDEAGVLADARALTRDGDKTLPLYGIPVAIKDNIDVKGSPTHPRLSGIQLSSGPGCNMRRDCRFCHAGLVLATLRPTRAGSRHAKHHLRSRAGAAFR